MNSKARGMIIALGLAVALAASAPSARAQEDTVHGAPVHREAGMADIVPPEAIGGFTGISGFLTCHVADGFGFVFGSSRKLLCVYVAMEATADRTLGRANFRPAYTEYYTGSIAKFGPDIGYLQSGVIVWTVRAPTSNLSPGALAGHYNGTPASEEILVGTTPNMMLGGVNSAIVLQPVSFVRKEFENVSDAAFKSQRGLNAAAGIGEMTLTFNKQETAKNKQETAKSTR